MAQENTQRAHTTPQEERLETLTRCPICHSPPSQWEHVRTTGPYTLVKCNMLFCKTLFLSVRAVEEDMIAQYSSPSYYTSDDGEHGFFDYASEEKAIRATTRRRLRLSNPFIPGDDPRDYLEIGGALGFSAQEAERMGYYAAMVEFCEDPLAFSSEAGIPTFHPSEIPDLRDDNWDVVVAWDVLEHLYDIRDMIDQVHRTLRPGGVFLFSTPDTASTSARLLGNRWWGYKFPEHVIYLNQSNVNHLFHSFRWRIDHHEPDLQYITFKGAALRLARTLSPLLPLWLMHPTSRVFDCLKLSNIILPIPHGNRLYIVSKQHQPESPVTKIAANASHSRDTLLSSAHLQRKGKDPSITNIGRSQESSRQARPFPLGRGDEIPTTGGEDAAAAPAHLRVAAIRHPRSRNR